MSDQTSKRLSEIDLKCLYLERLRQLGQIDANSIIASEYSLGQTGRRADLAILNHGFIGVEFKSKYDSLRRLKQQLGAYIQCFDRVVLVADERHIVNVQSLMPVSVELWSVSNAGQLSIVKEVEFTGHPSARVLAQLCTIRQLRKLVSIHASSTLSRSRLTDAVLQLPVDMVYQAAIARFRSAFARSSAAFWSDLESREIDGKALGSLSRFAGARQRQTLALKDQSEFWQAWVEEAAIILGSQQSVAAAANQSLQISSAPGTVSGSFV
jgi:hypothetical protein